MSFWVDQVKVLPTSIYVNLVLMQYLVPTKWQEPWTTCITIKVSQIDIFPICYSTDWIVIPCVHIEIQNNPTTRDLILGSYRLF